MKEEFAWKMWAAEQVAYGIALNMDYYDSMIRVGQGIMCVTTRRLALTDMLKMEVFRKVEPLMEKTCETCFFMNYGCGDDPCYDCRGMGGTRLHWRKAE